MDIYLLKNQVIFLREVLMTSITKPFGEGNNYNPQPN